MRKVVLRLGDRRLIGRNPAVDLGPLLFQGLYDQYDQWFRHAHSFKYAAPKDNHKLGALDD